MTLLKFTDVSLAFGAMPLLDKVSWQIARGERVCIIGRNACLLYTSDAADEREV